MRPLEICVREPLSYAPERGVRQPAPSYKLGEFGPPRAGFPPGAYLRRAMMFQKIVTWFLPAFLRDDQTHPGYYQLYTVAIANITGTLGMAFIALMLALFGLGTQLWTYGLAIVTYVITLLSLRLTGHWRLPTSLCALVAYYIIFTWLKGTGLIFSVNVAMLHLYVIAAILVDRTWGWISILTNVAFFCIIYYLTIHATGRVSAPAEWGSPLYATVLHTLITLFIGGFLAYVVRSQERSRRQIKALQDEKISVLDEAVRKRTEQLNSIRHTIATDFHDHTGNVLAAINRQAAMLELKMAGLEALLPLVRNIIANSDELYASSKDFIWNLNHDSDDPLTLFRYLTGYGQNFYNQFDISFSAEIRGNRDEAQQLSPFAALNLIYIFKEAMGNVVRHSAADEVFMTMTYGKDAVSYALRDNGRWKEADPSIAHHGLENMKRRSRQSGFGHTLNHGSDGTLITISAPLTTYFVKKDSL